MRITKVSVTGLFGMFDHEIPLNQESRITIIHGPNGVGKTVLLRMIHGLFNSMYEVFFDIPFCEFCVQFDNKQVVSVESYDGSKIYVRCHSRSGQVGEAFVPENVKEIDRRRFQNVVREIPQLDRYVSNLWLNEDTGAIMSMEEVIETFGLYSKLFGENDPQWLSHIRGLVHTRFIQAQRLQSSVQPVPNSRILRRRERPNVSSAAVERYSLEIANTIQNTLAEYGRVSQLTDRSFPKRLMESKSTDVLAPQTLQRKLDELEDKSSDLTAFGLLDKDDDAPEIPNLENKQENLTALSIYVQDIEAKFAVFDEIAKQLQVLTDIINDRFTNKKLIANKSDGFLVIADDGTRIPLVNLSSGEQHELVLLYQLLFHVKQDSLILIDEPEISLHVNWQENFLSDIQRASELRKFDVLMATHSPDIIGDKHEWMVDLGELEHA